MSQVTWLRNTGENPFKRLLLGPKFRFPYFEFRFNGISFIKLKCFFFRKGRENTRPHFTPSVQYSTARCFSLTYDWN